MRISDMKKFVCKWILFIVCMLVVDYAFGILFDYLRNHAKGGPTLNDTYVSKNCDADILVLGSSRAAHHYDPDILDSIGGKAFNGGMDGMGIVLGLGRYLLCAEKHVPKVVIYEITPEFDYMVYGNNPSKYLHYLRPYYKNASIKAIFDRLESRFEQLKMVSNIYCNNSKLLANIGDFIIKRENVRGFYPQTGTMNIVPKFNNNSFESIELDSLKLGLMQSLISETSRFGSKLYFAISPRYFEKRPSMILSMYLPALELAKENGIPVLDNMFIPNLSDNPQMFTDYVHMNYKGSKVYSHMVKNRIYSDCPNLVCK